MREKEREREREQEREREREQERERERERESADELLNQCTEQLYEEKHAGCNMSFNYREAFYEDRLLQRLHKEQTERP